MSSHPQRENLIRLSREAHEQRKLPAFDRRVTAAITELRAAREQVRSRHGEIVLREAEREVYGR